MYDTIQKKLVYCNLNYVELYVYFHHPGLDFFALGMKGTLTISGSTMTQTITHLTAVDPAEWFTEETDPDLWNMLTQQVQGGQTSVYIFGMSPDINHLFLHTDDYMPYPGDAILYVRQ